jgi:glucokinase
MSWYSIGVDLGGTNLRAAAFDVSGKMLAKVAGRTPIEQGPGAVVADMVFAVEQLRGQFGRENLAGIGAGVPGNILIEEGTVAGWGNMPSFNGFPMRAELESRLGARVFLENDANAAALGEKWMGAGKDFNDLVLLTLGTGVGGGIITNGEVLHGYLGMAAELGHITVVPNGSPCGCGNRGCVEKYASASAIAAMSRNLVLGRDLAAEEVFNLALAGNLRARDIFCVVGESLGIALAALINTFNFPLYLIGGGVIGAWDLFAPAMLAEVERRCFTFRAAKAVKPTRIERASLGNQAGLYGAAFPPLREALRKQ